MIKKAITRRKKKSFSLLFEVLLLTMWATLHLLLAIFISKYLWINAASFLLLTSLILGPAFAFLFHRFTGHWWLYLSFWVPLLITNFFLIPVSKLQPISFQTLITTQKIASDLEKRKIEMDNQDLLKPVYDKYYLSIATSWSGEKISRFLEFVRLKKEDQYFHPLDFPMLLKSAIAAQELQTIPKGDFVVKVRLSSESKLIVFGDLQGAFPSFVRDLAELQKQGIIDENYKIKNKNDFIVLTGDAVSRSPYQLEHLSLILKIYLQNKEQFFYIRGKHESESYWQEFNLKSEINLRLSHFFGLKPEDKNPLLVDVDAFFSRLPIGIYFELPRPVVEGEDLGFIRISHSGAEGSPSFSKENESKLQKFLRKNLDGKIFATQPIMQIQDEKADEPILLKAIIKSEKIRQNYQDMDGMRLLSPENGVPAWTVLSCPTEVFQKGLKFVNDAFVIITIEQEVKNTKIVLNKQDARSQNGFEKRSANLFSSKQEGPSGQKTKSEKKSEEKETID